MDTAKNFVVTPQQEQEIQKWKAQHNTVCRSSEWSGGAISQSKFRYTFRASSVIEFVEVLCDYGERFSPEHNI